MNKRFLHTPLFLLRNNTFEVYLVEQRIKNNNIDLTFATYIMLTNTFYRLTFHALTYI